MNNYLKAVVIMMLVALTALTSITTFAQDINPRWKTVIAAVQSDADTSPTIAHWNEVNVKYTPDHKVWWTIVFFASVTPEQIGVTKSTVWDNMIELPAVNGVSNTIAGTYYTTDIGTYIVVPSVTMAVFDDHLPNSTASFGRLRLRALSK